MSMKRMRGFFAISFVALGFMLFASAAYATSYGFYNITNNGNSNLSTQLSVDVETVGTAQVSFTFYNAVGIASVIDKILFDDSGALLGISSVATSTDVKFTYSAKNEVLPGGTNLDPDFVTTKGFSAEAANPAPKNGVNSSDDWVEIVFSLSTGKTIDDVISALNSGELRIGLHVISIGQNAGSDSYVNGRLTVPPPQVPEPATLLLLGLGMLGVAGIRRKINC